MRIKTSLPEVMTPRASVVEKKSSSAAKARGWSIVTVGDGGMGGGKIPFYRRRAGEIYPRDFLMRQK
jgi:hypothetical protein